MPNSVMKWCISDLMLYTQYSLIGPTDRLGNSSFFVQFHSNSTEIEGLIFLSLELVFRQHYIRLTQALTPLRGPITQVADAIK